MRSLILSIFAIIALSSAAFAQCNPRCDTEQIKRSPVASDSNDVEVTWSFEAGEGPSTLRGTCDSNCNATAGCKLDLVMTVDNNATINIEVNISGDKKADDTQIASGASPVVFNQMDTYDNDGTADCGDDDAVQVQIFDDTNPGGDRIEHWELGCKRCATAEE